MKLRWKPAEFAFLPVRQRAVMYAFIDQRVKDEEAERKKIERRSRIRNKR